jgi:hypothetical protein
MLTASEAIHQLADPAIQARVLVALMPLSHVWMGVQGSPSLLVSDRGHIASVRSGKLKILKGGARGAGYLAVNLDNGESDYIHRIACREFYGPQPTARHEVRHLDGNFLNNDMENICWGTRKENAADRVRHGTDASGERNPMAKLTRETVAAMRRMRAETGASYRVLGKRFGVTTMTAYRAVTALCWK